MKNEWKKCVLFAALAVGASHASVAQDAPTVSRAPVAPAGDVASGQEPGQAGLLLPAVQKVREAPARSSSAPGGTGSVQTAPQKGIEPDEIDNKQSVADQSPASPARATQTRPGTAGTPATGTRASTQQMMLKLKPRTAGLVPVGSGGGGAGAGKVQAPTPEPPKYEIADCGTDISPMICCHHEEGDGSSCNLFKILCENAGGTAQGDGESAACSDW